MNSFVGPIEKYCSRVLSDTPPVEGFHSSDANNQLVFALPNATGNQAAGVAKHVAERALIECDRNNLLVTSLDVWRHVLKADFAVTSKDSYQRANPENGNKPIECKLLILVRQGQYCGVSIGNNQTFSGLVVTIRVSHCPVDELKDLGNTEYWRPFNLNEYVRTHVKKALGKNLETVCACLLQMPDDPILFLYDFVRQPDLIRMVLEGMQKHGWRNGDVFLFSAKNPGFAIVDRSPTKVGDVDCNRVVFVRQEQHHTDLFGGWVWSVGAIWMPQEQAKAEFVNGQFWKAL